MTMWGEDWGEATTVAGQLATQDQRTCVHFTGVYRSDACAAGVNYRDLAGGSDLGWVRRLPCWRQDEWEHAEHAAEHAAEHVVAACNKLRFRDYAGALAKAEMEAAAIKDHLRMLASGGCPHCGNAAGRRIVGRCAYCGARLGQVGD